jgi:hypothetical protein
MQEDTGAMSRLGHDCLLPNPSQFVIRQSNAIDTESAIKKQNIQRYGTPVTKDIKNNVKTDEEAHTI